MTSLEDELGAKLFVREPNRIRLSEAGRAFQEDADDILRAYDAAAEHVARIEGRNKPTFRVGYLPDGGMRYLSLLTRVLTESSPECSLKY